MRCEEARRPSVIESVRLHLRLALVALGRSRHGRRQPAGCLSHLSGHQLRDIGLQGFERGFDWWRFR